MFEKEKYKIGTTKSLLHWQGEWFKRFLLTWYHIVNRKAYWRWKLNKKLNNKIGIDEGFRFELDDFFGGR
jgi:hypothetical protein